jgi:hypothetical protein
MSDPTTLRDAIESAIDSAPAEEAAPTPAPEPSPEAVEAAPAPEAKAADTASSRSRDEQGRFSKLAEEEAAKPPQEAPQAIQPGPKAEPKAKPAERAPASWRPDVREHWAQLPESVREEVARRESEVQRTKPPRRESSPTSCKTSSAPTKRSFVLRTATRCRRSTA